MALAIQVIPDALADLMAPLWDKPADFELWGVVADWCEENGLNDWNDCIRWLIKERRIACDYPKHVGEALEETKYMRSWYEEEYFRDTQTNHYQRNANVANAYVPRRLHKKLAYDQSTGQGKFYFTTERAYLALLNAWKKNDNPSSPP